MRSVDIHGADVDHGLVGGDLLHHALAPGLLDEHPVVAGARASAERDTDLGDGK